MIQIMMNEQATMHTKPNSSSNKNKNEMIRCGEKFLHKNPEMFDENF